MKKEEKKKKIFNYVLIIGLMLKSGLHLYCKAILIMLLWPPKKEGAYHDRMMA